MRDSRNKTLLQINKGDRLTNASTCSGVLSQLLDSVPCSSPSIITAWNSNPFEL